MLSPGITAAKSAPWRPELQKSFLVLSWSIYDKEWKGSVFRIVDYLNSGQQSMNTNPILTWTSFLFNFWIYITEGRLDAVEYITNYKVISIWKYSILENKEAVFSLTYKELSSSCDKEAPICRWIIKLLSRKVRSIMCNVFVQEKHDQTARTTEILFYFIFFLIQCNYRTGYRDPRYASLYQLHLFVTLSYHMLIPKDHIWR